MRGPITAPVERGLYSSSPPPNFQADDALSRYLGNTGAGPLPPNAGYGMLNPGTTTPTAPASGSAGGSVTAGGGATDWAKLISEDPYFQHLQETLRAGGIANQSQFRAALKQLLEQFGSVPNLPADVLANSGLDTNEVSQLAANNPFSVLKQLQKAYETKQVDAKNSLAARGILNSGETGYQLGNLGHAQAQSQYDATNALLGSIGGLNSTYVQQMQDAANQLASGALTAEQNVAAQNPTAPSVTATYDPGSGLYRSPDGRYFDANGNPASPHAAAPAPPTPAAPQPSAPGFPPVLSEGERPGRYGARVYAE